ncbi:transglutaminase [Leptolyngbya sp. 'hensonii']|uniref:transglutaminase domain-containing protein n=1 Tax=Leptolyngbya sp. 'hensonii' TaxID=1922337 RepID=UPI00094F53A9|nr:transglutaminase domain-containing protein [Leptolyngbya sp. 'hensonii']OLP18164.1 transglutaminase [Leptolyngbya sp. 'hensonii']
MSQQMPDLNTIQQNPWLQTIRPIGASELRGLTVLGDTILAIDALQGYLLQVRPGSDSSIVLNPYHTEEFKNASGLALWENALWFSRGNDLYRFQDEEIYLFKDISAGLLSVEAKAEHVVNLPYEIDGVAVWENTVYASSQRAGYIYVLDASTGKQITRFYAPGIGIENLTVRHEELWVCDREEQTVYCLDRGLGNVQFSVLTPFDRPSGLTFCGDTLYVAYALEEPYIRDNPNADPPVELTYRDRTFIHPLYYHYYQDEHYALSNGFLVELSYVEELSPVEASDLQDADLQQVEWRIALPAETPRQKVRQVESVGMPFIEEVQDGQRVALFKFDRLKSGERRIFGWKAVIEVWGIKYLLSPRQVENLPAAPPEYEARYLVDNDELAMGTDLIKEAARESIGTETNLLRKILKIRNYVYDRLSYGIKPYIDTPDVALERGIGSCGEYLGVLLALARLNGIICRTVGRYKCPKHPDRPFVPLEPDFNHVWMEFYVPGFGWFPMESNPDDIQDGGPYPTRFFMGLAWYHTEIGKGITFEAVKTPDKASGKSVDEAHRLSIGNLSLNHVRYRILAELKPAP